MTPLPLSGGQLRAYTGRLFGSHDFAVYVDVLDLDEKPRGTGVLLDGQINLHADTEIRRTGSLLLSDPEGVFDFADASTWSPRSVWANRLIRVRHSLTVPGVPGGQVTTTVFVGPPSSMERSGAEVRVECQDKTALAMRGCPPMTVKKGMNAVDAIERIMRERTGEFRFRMPRSKRRLSRPYSVGWPDEAAPMVVVRQIARRELGMQVLYSADGFFLVRPKPSQPSLTVPGVTEVAAVTADFTELANWVLVRGRKVEKTKNIKGGGSVKTTAQPEAIARIPAARSLSPETLARKGVPRYWPEIVEDDKLRTLAAVSGRAREVLAASDQLEAAPSFSCVPFFHGDNDDLVTVETPAGSVRVRLGDCSIPVGVGGDMTIGTHAWVSNPQGAKVRSRVVRTRHIRHPKKKKSDKKKGAA